MTPNIELKKDVKYFHEYYGTIASLWEWDIIIEYGVWRYSIIRKDIGYNVRNPINEIKPTY